MDTTTPPTRGEGVVYEGRRQDEITRVTLWNNQLQDTTGTIRRRRFCLRDSQFDFFPRWTEKMLLILRAKYAYRLDAR